VLFHCRRPCPASSGVNGNGKFIILCVLCLPRSSRRWYWGGSSEAPVITGTSPALRDRLGGEYKLIYLHSKAGTFSLAEGLMDQLIEPSGSFSSKSLSLSGMDDLFLKRVLFEWLRDR
jgi:hypothetical protein